MIRVPESLPVPHNQTLSIVDASKALQFEDCPRGFFYRYVLGLTPDIPNVHLDFGTGWHAAMETLLKYGYSATDQAYLAFLHEYRKAFPDEMTDADRSPKSPEYAYKAIQKYVTMYQSDRWEVLHTEVAGLIPVDIDRNRYASVKIDAILRDVETGLIWGMDHKTTKANSRPWRESFNYSLQVETYYHALNILYPPEQIGGYIINGAIFTKSKIFESERIEIHKSSAQMLSYLWTINHIIDMIDWNMEQLSQCHKDDKVMTAFPVNSASCAKFGCRNDGLCGLIPNPIKFADKPPAGYKVEWWNPLKETVETSRNIIESVDGKLKIVPHEPVERKQKEQENFDWALPPDEQ